MVPAVRTRRDRHTPAARADNMSETPETHGLSVQPNLFLGYGTAARRRGASPFLIGGAAIGFLCILLGFILHLFLGKTIPIPDGTVALFYLSPRGELSVNAPETWRSARENSRRFPVFFGYARRLDGNLEPFEITAGVLSWKLRAPEHTSASFVRASDIPMRKRDLLATAWLGIWPDGRTDARTAAILGPLHGRAWETNVAAPGGASNIMSRLKSFHLIDLAALPGEWPRIQNMFDALGFNLLLEEPPSVVEWKNGSGTVSVALHFDSPITSSTRERIAAAAGITEGETFLLPDGTLGRELHVPKLEEGARELETPDGRVLVFSERRVYVGDSDGDVPEPINAPCDNQGILAVFDGSVLETLFLTARVPSFVMAKELFLASNGGRLSVCW